MWNYKYINSGRSGFTLIELLVVIAIITILSTLVLASLNKARLKARDVKRLSDMRQVMNALEFYYDENGQYPTPDGDGCGGWDVGNKDYPFLNGKLPDFMDNPPRDSVGVGNCNGYRYYRYGAGSNGCDPLKGAYYVLGVTDMETSGNPHPLSTGWSCSSRNWQTEMDWVTGRFESL